MCILRIVFSKIGLFPFAHSFLQFLVAQSHDYFWVPDMISRASRHSRGNSYLLVNPREIVVHKVKDDHSCMIIRILGESICQLRKAARSR